MVTSWGCWFCLMFTVPAPQYHTDPGRILGTLRARGGGGGITPLKPRRRRYVTRDRAHAAARERKKDMCGGEKEIKRAHINISKNK